MDHRELERQKHLEESFMLISQAMEVPETEYRTVLEYRYKRWNLTMKAIATLLRSLRVHPVEIDSIEETVRQASSGHGWRVT